MTPNEKKPTSHHNGDQSRVCKDVIQRCPSPSLVVKTSTPAKYTQAPTSICPSWSTGSLYQAYHLLESKTIPKKNNGRENDYRWSEDIRDAALRPGTCEAANIDEQERGTRLEVLTEPPVVLLFQGDGARSPRAAVPALGERRGTPADLGSRGAPRAPDPPRMGIATEGLWRDIVPPTAGIGIVPAATAVLTPMWRQEDEDPMPHVRGVGQDPNRLGKVAPGACVWPSDWQQIGVEIDNRLWSLHIHTTVNLQNKKRALESKWRMF